MIVLQVSGLVRKAKREDILKDYKNRLIKPYFEIVSLLKPAYVITEQMLRLVPIFKEAASIAFCSCGVLF